MERQNDKTERVRDADKRARQGEKGGDHSGSAASQERPEDGAGGGHCEPGCCGLRSNFLSLRWRRSFRLFCLGFLSVREHRSREVLRVEGTPSTPRRL